MVPLLAICPGAVSSCNEAAFVTSICGTAPSAETTALVATAMTVPAVGRLFGSTKHNTDSREQAMATLVRRASQS